MEHKNDGFAYLMDMLKPRWRMISVGNPVSDQ